MEVFEVFCNKSVAGSTSPELFARFCSSLLKKTVTKGDDIIEDNFGKVAKLFAYFNDKDIFGEFYQKKLAFILLYNKSTSEEHERCLLTKLKEQFGRQFTSKMEGMAAVLFLFASTDRHSYAEIKGKLNLTDEVIARLLHSLSCSKHKVLNKDPNTKTVTPADFFEFNSNFTDSMRRIKILLPPLDEKKKVIQGVDADRRDAIDATVIRLMKARKVLPHQDLVDECIQQLQRMFKPDVKLIKKIIEDLIEREFLERSKEYPNMYRYLA